MEISSKRLLVMKRLLKAEVLYFIYRTRRGQNILSSVYLCCFTYMQIGERGQTTFSPVSSINKCLCEITTHPPSSLCNLKGGEEWNIIQKALICEWFKMLILNLILILYMLLPAPLHLLESTATTEHFGGEGGGSFLRIFSSLLQTHCPCGAPRGRTAL